MMNKALMQAYEDGAYTIVKAFNSKKNQVLLIRLDHDGEVYMVIMKVFSKPENLKQELRILNDLHAKKIKTVNCFGQSDNVLLYEYINTMTLCEFLEKVEPIEAVRDQKGLVILDEGTLRPFKKAIDWLGAFQKETGLAFYDINLRNFLLCHNDVMAIDFEDVKETDFAIDYGRFLAFILTYTPSFTAWKKALVTQLEAYIKANFNVAFEAVMKAKAKELTDIEKRRKGFEKGI